MIFLFMMSQCVSTEIYVVLFLTNLTIIRFFVSGGKDSIAAVVTTVVVEEVIKSKIKDAGKKSQNKKRY